MVIYIENSLSEISKRSGFGEEAYENVDFQAKVKKVYEENLMENDWFKVDGMRSIDSIAEEIYQEVVKLLEGKFGLNSEEMECPELKSLFVD